MQFVLAVSKPRFRIYFLSLVILLLFRARSVAQTGTANTHHIGVLHVLPPPPTASELLGISVRESVNERQCPAPGIVCGAYLSLAGNGEDARSRLSALPSTDMTLYWLVYATAQQGNTQLSAKFLPHIQHIDAYFAERGLLAQKRSHFRTATRLLRFAARCDRGTLRSAPSVYEALSKNAYHHESDMKMAIYWAKKWIEVAPGKASAYSWLAGLYIWQKQPEAAFEVLHTGDRWGVQETRHYAGQMGQIAEARGHLASAIAYYRKALEGEEARGVTYTGAAWRLGRALQKAGQVNEARFWLQYVAKYGDGQQKR